MAKYEKIAITKNGKDICRIIPINPNNGEYDFKMAFHNNEFDIVIYKLLEKKPLFCKIYDSIDWEITYHRKTEKDQTKIHLKHKPVDKPEQFFDSEHEEYITLPLEKLLEPIVNTLFPIPLMKIEITDCETAKDMKYKKGKHIIDLQDSNILEIFLFHQSYDYEKFMHEWPGISLNVLTMPFEFFGTNNLDSDHNKGLNIFSKNSEPRCAQFIVSINHDMKLIINLFRDSRINERLAKTRITFIENELSASIMSMLQIAYPEPRNGEYDHLYLAAAQKKDLTITSLPFVKPMRSFNVFQDDLSKRNCSIDERDKLLRYADQLKKQLKTAITEQEKTKK
jgi:hypothetical protein